MTSQSLNSRIKRLENKLVNNDKKLVIVVYHQFASPPFYEYEGQKYSLISEILGGKEMPDDRICVILSYKDYTLEATHY